MDMKIDSLGEWCPAMMTLTSGQCHMPVVAKGELPCSTHPPTPCPYRHETLPTGCCVMATLPKAVS
ncbi:hypothetical protein E2C01_026526 [Portunus trituberculatus]|uniref:Uncharacterized protein n=1 Tax=Portunus trituberculatus TaxID=210409 RepID=A0A5B7EJF2_PORTR|nr:hypothetical protein [Portunus trituberculatus]